MSTTTTTKPRTTRKAAPKAVPAATEEHTVNTKSEPTTETAEQGQDYTYLADKLPSELHERMATWITERTGVEVTSKSVQLVMSLRQTFRTSDEGRDLVESRKKAADKKRQEELAAKKAAAAKKMAELQAILDAE